MNESVKSTTIPKIEKQKFQAAIPLWRQLRWTLVLAFLLLAVIPVTVVLIITLSTANTQIEEQVVTQLESVVDSKQNEINLWLEDGQFTLNLLAADRLRRNQLIAFTTATLRQSVLELSENGSTVQNSVNEFFREALLADPIFTELFLYNLEGQIISSSNPVQIGKVVLTQPYFESSLAGDYVQPPYYEIGRGELSIFLTHPLIDDDGQVVGVLAGRLNITTLEQFMQSTNAGLGETGHIYLVSQENGYLLTQGRSESDSLTQVYRSRGINAALAGENNSEAYRAYDGTLVFGVYRWIPELRVGLIAEVDQTEALAAFTSLLNIGAGVAMGTIFLAILVGLYMATRIAEPITSLTGVATQIAAGNLDQRADLSQQNEIGLLANTFNTMADLLQDLISSLEQRVADRTERLEISAALSERLTAILDFDQLLLELVNQVKERFGYYHAHVYILDAEKKNLLMTAGAGKAGQAMKEEGHKIALNAETSLVARAARTGEIVRVNNVREASDWLPNPHLPNTFSEMAVPIILQGEVVGVLDVQQDSIAGLDESDASLLRSLANQVAIAIRNARLFAEVESSLEEAREIQRQYIEEAWDQRRVRRHSAGQVQVSLTEENVDERLIIQAKQQALAQTEPTVISLDNRQKNNENDPDSQKALVAPLVLRGIPIGNLQLHGFEPHREWTQNELDLVVAVIDQVVQTAENLRLLDDAQERASREQLVTQISDKLRQAPDIQTLMEVGVSELSRILNPGRTFIRFGGESELGTKGNGDKNRG